MKRHIAKELYFETLFTFNHQTLTVDLLSIMDENKPFLRIDRSDSIYCYPSSLVHAERACKVCLFKTFVQLT